MTLPAGSQVSDRCLLGYLLEVPLGNLMLIHVQELHRQEEILVLCKAIFKQKKETSGHHGAVKFDQV